MKKFDFDHQWILCYKGLEFIYAIALNGYVAVDDAVCTAPIWKNKNNSGDG